jgi:hypothetical protein
MNARKRTLIVVPAALSATLLAGVGPASAFSDPFVNKANCVSGASLANWFGRVILGVPGTGGQLVSSGATSQPGAVAQVALGDPCKQ